MTDVAFLGRWWSNRQTLAGIRGLAAIHRVFLALFGIGLALRIVVSIAYDPALLRPDSVSYLRLASHPPKPGPFHPIGYPSFLNLLPFEWSIAVAPVVHHLFGLLIATTIYTVLMRLGVTRWLAALAAAPVLLDAYQLNIEQHVLSEALFELFLVAACALLLWKRPLGVVAAGLAGLVLAAAALTRSIGIAAVLPALIVTPFLAGGMTLRARLVRPLALALAFAIPVLGYATWFHSVHGKFSLTTYGGRFLYGRVIPFADCKKFSVPAWERPLCPRAPPGERLTANQFMWSHRYSPIYRLDLPAGKTGNEVVGDFADRVVRSQPLDYAAAVGSDLLRVFGPTKRFERDDVPLSRWYFASSYRVAGDVDWSVQLARVYRTRFEFKRAEPSLASFLRNYQRFVYTWGPLLAASLLVALLALLGLWGTAHSGLRAAAFLFAGTGFILSLASVATTIFSWRYHLPQIVLIPPAAAIALTALRGGRRPGLSLHRSRAPAGSRRE